jgi:hypothetical protein
MAASKGLYHSITATGAETAATSISDLQLHHASFNIEPLLTLSLLQLHNGVTLKWNTREEMNIECFDILHSFDGVHYSRLARIGARGNSRFPSNYEWTHISSGAAHNYYRIQQFDKGGLFVFSSTMEIILQ